MHEGVGGRTGNLHEGAGVTTNEHKPSIFERLDELNEFERQPVSEDQLKGGRYFAGAFAGEHIAATEFVIGVLFVSFGARTFDVIVGLLLGNLLAVLSWTLVCAPIAVRTRLTLYWYLHNVVGRPMMVIYNVLNAVLYCILGGAMITVSASAVRIPFGIPEQTRWYPDDWRILWCWCWSSGRWWSRCRFSASGGWRSSRWSARRGCY